jgi:ribonuclease P protein component
MKNGKVYHSSLFLVRVTQTSKPNHFASVVSQKIAKTAVLRNKFKRIGYSLMREIIKNEAVGFNCILFFKAQALTATKNQMLEDLHNLFVKVGIIK